MNVRTYVEAGGKPGVWFLSLDAGNRLAAWAGRAWFDLPYFFADMQVAERDGWIEYRSIRGGPIPAQFEARYRPASEPRQSMPGTLEHWLTERYCLYSFHSGRGLVRVEVQHPPWPLCDGEVQITGNSMLSVHRLCSLRDDPLCHFARRLDVVVFPDEPVRPDD